MSEHERLPTAIPDALAAAVSGESSTLLWTTDQQLHVTWCWGCTPASAEFSCEQMTGRSVCECLDVQSPDASIIVAHRHALLGETISCDLDWQQQTLQAFVVPHRDQDGKVIGCLGVAREITHRDQEAAELYRLFNLSMQMLCVAGTDGCFKRVNPALEKTLGYTANALLERPFLEFVHPDDHESTKRELARLANGQATLQFENRSNYMASPTWQEMGGGRCLCARRNDGTEFPVEVRLSPVEVEGSRLIFAAVRDVSKREQLQRTVRENQVQLLAAQKIQQYLLPHAPPKIPGLDIAGVVMPANYAAGDQFDYIELGHDKLGIVVGDVSGHGFSSALVMASTHELLRAAATMCDDIGEVVLHANQALCLEVEDSLVTLILARLDLRTHELTYVNAGHPSGLVLDERGHLKASLESTAMPLAVSADEAFPVSGPIQLSPGDTVVLMTDGVLEASSPQDEMFGIERAIAVVRSELHSSSSKIIQSLCDAVRSFSEDDKFQDDVTVVVVRVGHSLLNEPLAANVAGMAPPGSV